MQGMFISKLQIPCQNNKFRSIDSDYIYRISYKNAKKANPVKWICPIEKTISQPLNRLQYSRYIADICNSEMIQNYTIYSNPLLSQLKRGYTGVALIKRSNCAFGCSIQALYSQSDRTVSGKPEFKKTISQGGNGFIDQDISILVNSFYIKRFFC